MGSGKMDEKAAKRIAAARGKKDSFAKRAELASRNHWDRERAAAEVGGGGGGGGGSSGIDGPWRKIDPPGPSRPMDSGRRAVK
ncbi:hypothetical protein SLS62_000576 [Diatrype stigma]|uniref:Uncharacterized protein n=1 Tax=Diatrype stigma TaxID=117547 RepID=A0AAN9V1M4_9PEZI